MDSYYQLRWWEFCYLICNFIFILLIFNNYDIINYVYRELTLWERKKDKIQGFHIPNIKKAPLLGALLLIFRICN